MYPHFIEVHTNENRITLNIDHIAGFGDTLIAMNGKQYVVDESYEELQKLITDAGALINKGDPRIDSRPLTMDDLTHMVGEPVWNSSLSRWHLVEKTEPDEYRGAVVILKGTHSAVWYYDSADLVRHPLYRMKEG